MAELLETTDDELLRQVKGFLALPIALQQQQVGSLAPATMQAVLKRISKAHQFSLLTIKDRQKRTASMTDVEAEALIYDWDFWARPSQALPVGEWITDRKMFV